jgi:hypothetical protein
MVTMFTTAVQSQIVSEKKAVVFVEPSAPRLRDRGSVFIVVHVRGRQKHPRPIHTQYYTAIHPVCLL